MSAGARHCADIQGAFAGEDYAPLQSLSHSIVHKSPHAKAPLRDFVWGSILNRGVIAFSRWRDGLPEKRETGSITGDALAAFLLVILAVILTIAGVTQIAHRGANEMYRIFAIQESRK